MDIPVSDFSFLLSQIRARVSFPLMQDLCDKHGLPTAQGWDRLDRKLRAEAVGNLDRSKRIATALERIFMDSIVAGVRGLQRFSLEPGDGELLAEYLESLEPDDSVYLDSYPSAIAQESLKDAGDALFLCEVSRLDESTTLAVFCGRRRIEEREPRSRDDMGEAAIAQFGWEEYDEFVLVKRRYVQTYEVISVDRKSDAVEVRVDVHPGVDTAHSLNALLGRLNSCLAAMSPPVTALAKPVNWFKAIKGMYDAPAEGVVVELGFTTDTGSAKHEKMRKDRDLRTELFHAGGKAALGGVLFPFRLAVRWPAPGRRAPNEVLLPGSIRQVGAASQHLGYLIVSGCGNDAEVRASVERVAQYL